MVETRRLDELIENTADRLALPDGDLVVALSGGADSAALGLLALSQSSTVTAVHVDHGFESSAGLRSAAERTAQLLGLSLLILETEVPPGPSIEGQARKARYEALAEGVPASRRIRETIRPRRCS